MVSLSYGQMKRLYQLVVRRRSPERDWGLTQKPPVTAGLAGRGAQTPPLPLHPSPLKTGLPQYPLAYLEKGTFLKSCDKTN